MHLRKRADTVALPPKPVAVAPSGDFDGNDGKWSTFIININSDDKALNGQDFKVLISTSSSLPLLPAPNEYCNEDCAAKRGVLPSGGGQVEGVRESENWEKFGTYTVPVPNWYSGDFTGENGTIGGTWGVTNVGLGRSSIQSLVNPKLFAVKYTSNAWFMGTLGLSAGEVGTNGATRPTFLSQFKDRQVIASASYGYTAGAIYRK